MQLSTRPSAEQRSWPSREAGTVLRCCTRSKRPSPPGRDDRDAARCERLRHRVTRPVVTRFCRRRKPQLRNDICPKADAKACHPCCLQRVVGPYGFALKAGAAVGILDRIRGRLSTTRNPPLPRQLSDGGQSTGPFASPVGGFAVVDVETTGLMTHRDRVVEVAVITTKIHGVTAADVRSGPRFAELIGEMNARLSGRALVAHNAR